MLTCTSSCSVYLLFRSYKRSSENDAADPFGPGVGIAELNTSRDQYTAVYEAFVPKTEQSMNELQALCKLLENGKHADAEASETALAECRAKIAGTLKN